MTRSGEGEAGRAYHHGDLRHALLALAATIAADEGPSAIALRDLARRAGVSHAAPAHHFGDRRGLLTALAVEGFAGLTARLDEVLDGGGSFTDQGAAYVLFAVAHPGHFATMWRFDLLDPSDPALAEAAGAARRALDEGARRHAGGPGADAEAVAVAGWSFAHGLATLLAAGLVDPGDDLEGFVRRAGQALTGGGPA